MSARIDESLFLSPLLTILATTTVLVAGAAVIWRSRQTHSSSTSTTSSIATTSSNLAADLGGLALPQRASDVSDAFVTRVLQQCGVINATQQVRVDAVRKLDGGVHYEVAQLALLHSGDGDVPKSVVVKMFTGTLLWYQRVLLRIDERLPPRLARWLWPSLHATALRIKSYKIESRLYKRYSRILSIPTPRAFYCHSDLSQVRFLVVLEDLCGMDRGEPHGFSLQQAEHLVCALARFHRSSLQNAEMPKLLATDKFWSFGGYWFGPKEMLYGTDVVRGANHLVAAFGDAFDDTERRTVLSTARLLGKVGARLTEMVHALTPRVLLHGDYKISNLFINGANKVYAIDWQWLGGGFPAADLAYFVYTSVRYEDLIRSDTDIAPTCRCDEEQIGAFASNAHEREYDAFVHSQSPEGARRGSARGRDSAASVDRRARPPISDREFYHFYGDQEWHLMTTYYNELDSRDQISFALFERAYRLNVVYFALFCLRCKYSWLTPEHMHRYASVPEDGLHLRKLSHLKLLIKRASVLLQHSPALWQ
jgi:hypothetical protein